MSKLFFAVFASPTKYMRILDTTQTRFVFLYVILVAAVAIFAPGQVLRVVYPCLSALCALYLYSRNKAAYVGFAFWITFVTAFIRRLADNKAGYQEASPILVTPYLVLLLSAGSFVTRFRNLFLQQSLPILLSLVAVLYGLCVGLTRFSMMEMARPLIDWLMPLVFSFFLIQTSDRHAQIRAALEKAFVWAGLITGIYAIYQFFFLPAWDKLWLAQYPSAVFGLAEPLQIRAFSTMNSPIYYAMNLVCMIMIGLGSKLKIKAIAVPIAVVALILTLNRSAWLALAGAILYYCSRIPGRERKRIVLSLVALFAVGTSLLFLPATSDIIGSKFKSFSSLDQDVSFRARIDGYVSSAYALSREPFGEGMGSPDILHPVVGANDALGPHDSTYLELLYSLGWLGTTFYLSALGVLLYRLRTTRNRTKMEAAFESIFIGLMIQSPLAQAIGGGLGLLLWTSASLLIMYGNQPDAGVLLAQHVNVPSVIVSEG